MQKKIALLHRYPADRIKETNAAFPYLAEMGVDVLTFKKFNRLGSYKKFWKSIAWIFYAPFLVIGKGYDVIYCDDSYPFYPVLVKLVSPRSRVVLRIGDFHLMYHTRGVVYKILHILEILTWKMADAIIAISDVMADEINKHVKRPARVVFDPVDPTDFKLSSTDFTSRNTVMFHGVLTRNKNVDILLEAARRLPRIDFDIVGDGPDIRRLIHNAPPNVSFLGWVPFKDIKHYIGYCSVGMALRGDNPGNEYVVTSPYLQYGVMGKPCLVSRRKVFGNYRWQFSNIEELVQKIQELIGKSWAEGEKLQREILKYHDAEQIAEDIWLILTQR